STSRWEARHEEDHPHHRQPQGRDEDRDQGLLGPGVPRGEQVPRAGPRAAGRRAAHGRVLPGPDDRPADPAVAVTSAFAGSHPRRRAMFDACEQTDALVLIEAIAAALREELGIAIEGQPGFHDQAEAGQVDRAFRVMAATILRTIAPADEGLPPLLSRV